MKNEMSFTIKDGTSNAQLKKAINIFADTLNVDMLEVFVAANHGAIIVYWNGMSVLRRTFYNVQDLIQWSIAYNEIKLDDISEMTVF